MKKEKLKLERLTVILMILYLLLFPLGQLVRIERMIVGNYVVIHPIEVISIFLTLIAFKNINKLIIKLEGLFTFFLVLLFSLLLSIGNYELNTVFSGLFYLVRYISFIGIFYGTFVIRKKYGKKFISNALMAAGLGILLFGWLQYFYYPDLRHLTYLGWDDHINRLCGAFLDPGFTGILLTLASIFSIHKYLSERKNYYMFSAIFLVFGVLFTYSRGSYLSLIAGVVMLIYFSKYSLRKIILLGIPIFLFFLLILPRPGGEGIRLERTYSVFARLTNYKETYEMWKSSPVFGIGFNNLCVYRLHKYPDAKLTSHSCSGADSSLMMILATSGLVGLISFIRAFIRNVRRLKHLDESLLVYSSIGAVFVHSLFSNSMFYPWVVGWIALIVAYISPKKSLRAIVDS